MAHEKLQPIDLPPGFHQRSSRLAAEGRYIDGDWVRSHGGKIQTMGGWDRFDPDAQVLGLARSERIWRALSNRKIIAVGTHRRLYTLISGDLENRTPIEDTGQLTDPFTTTNGSQLVTVTHTNHGRVENSFVFFSGASPVGGITIDGEYEVIAVPSQNTYQIVHSSAATSGATGGGTVDYTYELNPGLPSTADGFGYGVGPYGLETYGTPRSQSSIPLFARTWSLDLYGEDLMALPRDGKVYRWKPSTNGRATLLPNAPTNNKALFVPYERHLTVVGANGDPMAIQWADPDNPELWTPAADNQAGGRTLRGGSQLLAGGALRAGFNLIWSDTNLFRMVYLGQEPWWSIRGEAGQTGIAGPNAWAEIDGVAYWMGDENFYYYDGFPREMPNQNDVLQIVFDKDMRGVDRKQYDKVWCFVNIEFREVWWLYQSFETPDGDIDRYVMHNIDERVWYTGKVERTVWQPARIFDFPVSVGKDGYFYSQELGQDAEGQAKEKWIETAPFDLGDGDLLMDVNGFWPDFADQSGEIEILFFTRDNQGEARRQEGPETVTPTTEVADVRASGRQCAVRYTSNVVGGKFIVGRNKLEVAPAGRRRG